MTLIKTIQTDSPAETHALGLRIGSELRRGDCLALVGGLGAGKTVFVRGLAEALGCDVRLVSSPTYVLVQEYPARGRTALYHIDLYRMGDPAAEFAELGVEEMLAGGIVVIEWADRAEASLPLPRRQLAIDIIGPTSRRWTFTDVKEHA